MSVIEDRWGKKILSFNILFMRKKHNISSYDDFISHMKLPVSHESHFFYMCYCGMVDDLKNFVDSNLLIDNNVYSKGILYSIETSRTDVVEYLLSLDNFDFTNRVDWDLLNKRCTSSFLYKILINAPNHSWIEDMILESLKKKSSRNKFRKNLDYCANDILQYYISNNYFYGFRMLHKYNLDVITENDLVLAHDLPGDSKIRNYFKSLRMF